MITCSDAIKFLERQNDSSIDLILTDPPYNIGIRADWDRLEFDLDNFMKQARRVLSPTGQIIIFFDIWSVGKIKDALVLRGFDTIRLLTWVKSNAAPFEAGSSGYSSSSQEFFIYASKGARRPKHYASRHSGVFRYPKDHPNTRPIYNESVKPLALLNELLERHTKEGDLVCDPYVGSGSTMLSCTQLNRRFIGCDIRREVIEALNKNAAKH